eukprot:TRINITY_DN33072_c0_g1_i1.p1 TRINITY_DN33072_c0_g1~~TRINITY_DN33072_c0_g1_i1.p1  ORF type:complete len:255 (+),score=60.95 TRINITY_DN33072_c0_g1_i1:76-765(+)
MAYSDTDDAGSSSSDEETWQRLWGIVADEDCAPENQPWVFDVGPDIKDVTNYIRAIDVEKAVPNRKMVTERCVIRTRMCTFFMQGKCSKGESCNFAHGKAYLQAKPQWQKTRLCKDFMKTGFCSAGDDCTWAHGKQELIRSKKKPKDPAFQVENPLKAVIKKTQVCKYHASGKCSLGTNCTFAHGVEELQERPDLKRTGLCRFMSKYGSCPWKHTGCKFAHSHEELRAM